MFPVGYFADNYFAPTYFPKVSAIVPPSTTFEFIRITATESTLESVSVNDQNLDTVSLSERRRNSITIGEL